MLRYKITRTSLIVLLLLGFLSGVQAQNIKNSVKKTNERKAQEAAWQKEQERQELERKREQERRELEWKKEQQRIEQEERKRQQQLEKERREAEEKENARLQKGQVTLADQLQILKTQNLDEVDGFLTSKGWVLQKVQDDNGQSGKSVVRWAFDKDPYSSMALAWCYIVIHSDNHNRREYCYQYVNEAQYKAYISDLQNNGFVTVSSDIVEGGICNVWKNDIYSATIIRSTDQDNTPSYMVSVYNYKREIEIEEEEKRLRQEQEIAEQKLYEERIAKARLSLDDILHLSQMRSLDSIGQFMAKKGWVSAGMEQISIEELAFSGKQFAYKISEDLKLSVDFIKINIPDNFAYDNIVEYQTVAGKLSKDEVEQNGFSLSDDSGIYTIGLRSKELDKNMLKQTTYNNNTYELDMTEHFSDQLSSESGYFTNYDYYLLFNDKQVSQRKAELEKQRQEEAKRQAQYQALVAKGTDAELKKDYRTAKASFKQALALGYGKAEMEERIKKNEIEILLSEADSFYNAKQYIQARTKLLEAKNITPNHRIGYIDSQLENLDQLQAFLTERAHTVYDYKIVSGDNFRKFSDSLLKALKSAVIANTDLLPTTRFVVNFQTDTFGITRSKYELPLSDKRLNNSIDKLFNNIQLNPCVKNGYIIATEAKFDHDMEYDHSVITVKKTPKGYKSSHDQYENYKSLIMNKMGNNAPYARYTYDIHKMVVDGQSDIDVKLTNMSVVGGPANAWLSVLVPGLGDHRVTYGARKGVGTAILTYAFVGAGTGMVLYGHYKEPDSKLFAYAGYSSLAVGGIIWLTDIIWVAARGAKNKKAFKEYQNAHLNVYYDPFLHNAGVGYSMTF